MPDEKKSLGNKLRTLRESYNFSQSQVAEALNIDRSTYTNYELDKTRPSLETLVKLAHIFNVPKVQLLPDEDSGVVTFKDLLRSDSMLQTLSKEERRLIACYRSLDSGSKAALREEMLKLVRQTSESDREE